MKKEKLFDAITNIRDDIVDSAGKHKFKKSVMSIRKWTALAACLALIVGIGYLWNNIGGKTGSEGSGRYGNGYTFMSYAGPVMPLTSIDNADGITAERSIDFDFSPYKTVQESRIRNGETITYGRHNTDSLVTDSYKLTNNTNKDITLTLAYPFAASFRDKSEIIPTLTVNGLKQEAHLHFGTYSGGFTSAIGEEAGSSSLNLQNAESWEEYKNILSDGSYLENAFSSQPKLTQPVIVYKVYDYIAPESTDDIPNPTLEMSFTIDYNNTILLSYGSNGGTVGAEDGLCARHVGGLGNKMVEPEDMYLILLGDDLTDYTLQGYIDGGCDEGEEIEIGATVTRYETTLESILYELTLKMHEDFESEETIIEDIVPMDYIYEAVAELLTSYGVLSETPADRYDFGRLDDIISESRVMDRVMYMSFDLTIPADSTVDITANMIKEASFDFYGTSGKSPTTNGYDMVTKLSSNINFTSQKASVSNTEYIDIIDQNFGFDLTNGIYEVELDIDAEHYWIAVCKKKK